MNSSPAESPSCLSTSREGQKRLSTIALSAAFVLLAPLALYLARRYRQRRWWICVTLLVAAKPGQNAFPESVTISYRWDAPDYDRGALRPLVKPIGGFSLFFRALLDRLRRVFGRG